MRTFLVKHWFVIALALGVGSAILFPDVVRPATDFWEPRVTVAISLFLMAWTMPTGMLLGEFKRPYAAIWAIVLSYVAMPLAAWTIGYLAPGDDVRYGLILISAVPCTLASAILWTRMAGGNEATALLTVMGTTFTSWFLTTAWLYLLTGTETQIDAVAVMVDLVLSLILPVILGQALRFVPVCAVVADRYKVWISIFAQLFVVAIVLRAGVTVGDRLGANEATHVPTVFLWSIVLAVGLHLLTLWSGLLTSRWFGFDRERQIAVAFSASQKTLQVSLVLYEQYFKERYPLAVMPLLFYHVGQLLLDTLIARKLLKEPKEVADTEAPPVD
jgi:sodium/bile acid cotransporter 7